MLNYLNITSVADFALDTFPVSGGTIILHNLWIGLPTLTLRGEGQTAVNNAAASIIRRWAERMYSLKYRGIY